jgi:HPt (histidine-containing phosphotransfer) domain-containing protein
LMEVIQRLTRRQPGSVATDNAKDEAFVASSTSTFEDLPGLAVTKGMRVWNDLAAYRKFLVKFSVDYADCVHRLRVFHAENDHAGAGALAHKLKGAAGNLALTEITQYTAEIEAIEANGGDSSEALDHLQSALETALASIAIFTAEETGQLAPSPAATDNAQAAPLLADLLHVLDSDNPDLAEPILDTLARALSPEALIPLRACIDDFDFRGAEAVTRRLAADLLMEE